MSDLSPETTSESPKPPGESWEQHSGDTHQGVEESVQGPYNPDIFSSEVEMQSNAGEETSDHLATDERPVINLWERTKNFTGKYRARLALGVIAASATATLTTNPLSDIKDDVVAAAPWALGGVAASEVAFVTGAAMMLASVGTKIGNPLKLKEKLHDIAERANTSKLFKAGFWLNATGAVGDFVAISAGVIKEMPVSSYPILPLTLLDLACTIAVRKAVLDGIESNLEIKEH